MHSFAKATLL